MDIPITPDLMLAALDTFEEPLRLAVETRSDEVATAAMLSALNDLAAWVADAAIPQADRTARLVALLHLSLVLIADAISEDVDRFLADARQWIRRAM
jgi:hypothetical protein